MEEHRAMWKVRGRTSEGKEGTQAITRDLDLSQLRAWVEMKKHGLSSEHPGKLAQGCLDLWHGHHFMVSVSRSLSGVMSPVTIWEALWAAGFDVWLCHSVVSHLTSPCAPVSKFYNSLFTL